MYFRNFSFLCAIEFFKFIKMKSRFFISLLAVAMGMMVFNGCQKRSSCNGGIQGHLEVLDEPYETDPNFFYVSNVKVTANFYDSNNRITSVS